MRTNKEIKEKITELLTKIEVPLPQHETDSNTGIARLIMYYNKHSTDDMKNEMVKFLKK